MTPITPRSLFIAAALAATLVAGTVQSMQASESLLATVEGYDLARQRVDSAITFLEFLADGAFSPEERRAIIEEARSEFLRDPAGELRVYASIEDAAQRAASFRGDVVKEEEFREDTITAIYLDLLSKPAQERDSAATRALFGRASIITADSASRYVITKRGLYALLDANDFVAGLVGHQAVYAAGREKIAADIAAAFGSMPADDRYVLAHGASRWARLQIYWSGLAAADRDAAVAELKRKAPRPDDVPVAARQLETTSRLALLSQRINRNMGAILDVQAGAIVLDVMREKSRWFSK
jgi:hypothetical protein